MAPLASTENKQLKRDEAHAEKYLKFQGHADICHEPDGNQPPDFTVAGDIAIEVARLTKRELVPGGGGAIEDVRAPLLVNMLQILEELGPSVDKKSWTVWYRYRRPLPRLRSLKRNVRTWLRDFRDNRRTDQAEVDLDPNFTLGVFHRGEGPQAFVLGVISDRDLGGDVAAMMTESLRHVIDEKSKKVSGVLMNHQVWWLLLVDWIGLGPSLGTRQRVKQAVGVTPPWNKVILLNGANHTDAFELDLPD